MKQNNKTNQTNITVAPLKEWSMLANAYFLGVCLPQQFLGIEIKKLAKN